MPAEENNNNAPKVEPVGLPKEPETPDALDALRKDVREIRENLKNEVVEAFRGELKELVKPRENDRPPAERRNERLAATPGIKVTGHGSDPLYRSLTQGEQSWRNRHVDKLAQEWMIAVRQNDFENIRRTYAELNDLARANEVTEGAADSNGGIGSGTGADLIPTPVANVIVENRNRIAKIRSRAQIFTSPNQSLRVPRAAVAQAEMVQEGATASNHAAGLDTVLLTKKKMQSRFEITDEMLQDSAFNVITFFTRRAGAAMGQLEDEEFSRVVGSAASVTQSLEGIGGEVIVAPTTAGRLGYPDVVKLAFSLPEQYTPGASIFSNANGMQLLSNLLDGNGRPLFTPLLGAPSIVGDQVPGNIGTVLGSVPVFQIPLSTSGTSNNKVDIWYGNLGIGFAILDGGGFTVRASEHVGFNTDTVAWKVTQRIDSAVTLPAAFARIMGVSGTTGSFFL